MKHLDEFENYFQEQFEDFESEPEPESWQKIHDRLHGKRRRIFFWWWIPILAVAIIGAGYFLSKEKIRMIQSFNNLRQKIFLILLRPLPKPAMAQTIAPLSINQQQQIRRLLL